ncbi:MAG: hypothetical protein LBP72_10165 [Dysgonamonadaceae bacterium]|jgi:hypothetical protein|nr:hypothetical protein [Dysgonamonadaceae bacterium]
MKTKKKQILFFLLLMITGGISAQIDLTTWIGNPGFERNHLLDWTYSPPDFEYYGVHPDYLEGKEGKYNFYSWSPKGHFDNELSQTVTGLENGLYRVKCVLAILAGSDFMVQRLFAGNATDGYKSQFYGPINNYSAENLTIIGASETYTFAGHETFGTFKELSVDVPVTTGYLTIGIRAEGDLNTRGLTFPPGPVERGNYRADNFRLIKLPEQEPVDYSILQALVTECSEFLSGVTVGSDIGNYSELIAGLLQTAIDASQAMITGSEPSQATIDNQVTTLQTLFEMFKSSIIVEWYNPNAKTEDIIDVPIRFSTGHRMTTPSNWALDISSDKLFFVLHGKNLNSWGVYLDQVNSVTVPQENSHVLKVLILDETTAEAIAFINIPYAARNTYPGIVNDYLTKETVNINQLNFYAYPSNGAGEIDHVGFYTAGELLNLSPAIADYLSIDGENFYDLYFTSGGRASDMAPCFHLQGVSNLVTPNEYGLTPSAMNTWKENAESTINSRADKYLALSTLKANLDTATLKINFMGQTALGGNFDGTNIVAYAYASTGLGETETPNLKLLPEDTGLALPVAQDDIIAYSRDNAVFIRSAFAHPLKQVYVYNLQGRLIHSNACVNTADYRFEGNHIPEICILKVITENGIKHLKLRK